MVNKPPPESTGRRISPRYAIDLPARLIVSEGAPEQVRLIDLSRHGFRVASPLVLPAGHPVRLEVDGWPRLVGQVVWCDGGRIGCMIDLPLSDAVYERMRAATDGGGQDGA
jgi:hypothetical protein